MDSNEKKKGRLLKYAILLCILAVIIALVGYAWARYVSSQNGTATAQIAKWSFNSKIFDGTQTEEVENFARTRTDGNTEVDDETIAPGTSGEFIVEIDASRNRNIFDICCKF